jgi:hypothetical protein
MNLSAAARAAMEQLRLKGRGVWKEPSTTREKKEGLRKVKEAHEPQR